MRRCSLAVLEEAEGRVGLKLSGGIRTANQAAGYLHLIEHFMTSGWVSPRTVRFGASSLLDDLEKVLAQPQPKTTEASRRCFLKK